MHFTRTGTGPPLLLIHGLGGSGASWETIAPALAARHELIAVDLPGFGASPPLAGEVTIAAMADALEAFMTDHDLRGIDVAGMSMGARLALELVRRGSAGAAVALDPGGFWTRREAAIFGATVAASAKLLAVLRPLLPALTRSAAGRTLLLGQFSARPWALDGAAVRHELESLVAAPSFGPALHALVHGPGQEGVPVHGRERPVVIAWGRRDLVTLPRQAPRAARRFPGAELVWIDGSGHFPHWDAPDEAVRVILGATGA